MTDVSVTSPCRLQINGEPYTIDIPPSVTLLDLLRERLDLTGTKKGCDHGQCGACTVLVDGKRVKSCLILAVSIPDAEVTTIEGLTPDGHLHPMQRAFIDRDAFQCGYCTPGQIMSAVALLEEGHVRTREMGWLPSSPHGIAMCQNGRWKKRLRERTADEGYSDRR